MSSIVKGIQDTLTELKIAQMPDPSEHVASPEFDAEYRDFRTTPDWANNLLKALRHTIRFSDEAIRDNVVACTSLIKMLDDPRSGPHVQDLAREMHDSITHWHQKEAGDVSLVRRAEAFLSRFLGAIQQTQKDIDARNRALAELNARRGKLEQRVGRIEETTAAGSTPTPAVTTTATAASEISGGADTGRHAAEMTRLEKKIVTNMDEVEMLAGRYDVLNRQAVSGMRKAKDMRPRVVYAVLYAYAHYQHNALGTRPLKTHAERLVDQYPALVEASEWDDVEIDGKSVRSILERDDMARAKDVAAA